MTSPHILVVDDEADIRGLLKEILSEEGYEVDVAANAAQARASRARQVPDLVLLDIWMPDVDGITLLREWSAGVTDGCPVVMMSGHGTVETAVEATRLGAFDFVAKPNDVSANMPEIARELIAKIKAAAHSRRPSQAANAAPRCIAGKAPGRSFSDATNSSSRRLCRPGPTGYRPRISHRFALAEPHRYYRAADRSFLLPEIRFRQ